MTDAPTSIEASRRIAAAAPVLFAVVSTPARHVDLDGSDMLRGVEGDEVLTEVGDVFCVRMHRLGRDYLMINHVVELERDRRLTWAPAPGDLDTAGGDPSRIGVPSGYRWGFRLEPDGDAATVVTEVFDCGREENRWILERDGGSWINGSNPVLDSMVATLANLERLCTG